MNLNFAGKDFEITDAIKNYVTEKVGKLEKYFGDNYDVVATLGIEGNEQVAELRVSVSGQVFKAVTASKDLYSSIDKDIDILEGQIRKTKAKKEKQNMSGSIKNAEDIIFNAQDHKVENEILKTSYYELKPMSAEDAKLVLSERIKDNFLVFVNIDTNKVNVIYKLKDGKNFGLVEPEA